MICNHPPLSAATRIFQAHEEVNAVYLFGSMASGKTHPESDLDLGLRFSSPELARPKIEYLSELTAAGVDRVDLVYLHEADPTMQYEIVRHNRLLHAVPSFNRGEYYSNCLRRFFDLQPLLKIQRQAMKERLKNGTP